MKHLGDITKISGYDAPTVNVVIGGSPCQDLSLAGKRAGLSGARSGLFMEQIRIIKEMREKDARQGRKGTEIRPRFMVWENVPGAFSVNGGGRFRSRPRRNYPSCRARSSRYSSTSQRMDYFRSLRGRRMVSCLASSGRSVLGSPPTSPSNRACRRFWRAIRTRNTV